ncbi:MAG TPA: HlyD family efflux transporter periplasmic adaptor subunit [Abditibacteriaceae bacterium]
MKPSPSAPESVPDNVVAETSETTITKPAESEPLSRFIARRAERHFWISALPPLLFVGVAMSLRNPVPTNGVESAAVIMAAQNQAPITVLTAQETMVTSLKSIGGFATLSGELQPAIQVRGEAPIGGRITEVLVRLGQKVNVGDPILRVESQVKAPGSRSALRKQASAEAAQVAAARQQETLQTKLTTRQEKLLAAQQRVAQAKQRVAQARAVVGRLAKGERITRSEVAALATPELSTRLASRGSLAKRRNGAREAAEVISKTSSWRAAKKEAEQAQRNADLALSAANEAKRDAQKAAKEATSKKQAVKDAQTQLAKVQGEGKGDVKEAKTEALEEARTALAKAQVAAQDAETKADDLQKAATLAESKSERSRKTAYESDARLAKLPEPVSIAAPDKTAKPAETPTAVSTSLSANEAMKLAQAALDESRDAAAEAERLKSEINSYARQVKNLHAELNSTSANLETAQMAVVESKIAEKLEAVRAPATGVVLDVADSASHVAPGETIIAIGRPDQLAVRLKDNSDAWKALKIGTQLPASIQDGTQKTPVLAEVQEITAPKNGAPAILNTVIANPRRDDGTGRRFRPGLAVQCSIPRPGARDMLSIPSAALWRDEAGKPLVAVLVPVEANLQPGEPLPELAQDKGTFHVQWRTVTTGQGDALQQEIAGGLQPGERIALRPAPLHELTQKHGPYALIQLSA